MKLLITGATGFIGRNLVPEIIKQFPEINILTVNRSKEKAVELFPFIQCKHIQGIDVEAIQTFQPEIVFHLATLTSSEDKLEIICPMINANITFGVELLNVLSACPSLKLFVNTGSFSEYNSQTNKIENAYLYSATKTAFRVFVDYCAKLRGFKYITVVPYSVYGGIPTVKRLMDYIIESMNSDSPVKMTQGEQVLDFIHISDISSFFISILKNTVLFEALESGADFHLGTGIGTSIRQLATLIEKLSHKKCNIEWGGRMYRERDIMYAVAPIEKNSDVIKWEPIIKIETGLRRFLF